MSGFVYSNNIEFHHDFMCLVLGLRLLSLSLMPTDSEQMTKQYDKFGKYVRWS